METKHYPDDDARTVIQAQEVLNDPKRRKAAMKELKKQKEAADKAAQIAASNKTWKG